MVLRERSEISWKIYVWKRSRKGQRCRHKRLYPRKGLGAKEGLLPECFLLWRKQRSSCNLHSPMEDLDVVWCTGHGGCSFRSNRPSDVLQSVTWHASKLKKKTHATRACTRKWTIYLTIIFRSLKFYPYSTVTMPENKNEKKPSFSFHDYMDRFTLGTIAVAVAGIAAAVVLRRRLH